jgi:hypothetical protein
MIIWNRMIDWMLLPKYRWTLFPFLDPYLHVIAFIALWGDFSACGTLYAPQVIFRANGVHILLVKGCVWDYRTSVPQCF